MVGTFYLAVDAGTSRVAAATSRRSDEGAFTVLPFPLGRNSATAPNSVFVTADDPLFGDAAERRGLAQPERLIRDVRRRVGDEIPILVGGHRLAAEDLFARTVAWVVDTVTQREGGAPARVSVTVPATWGGHRTGLVAGALAREIPIPVDLISEPEAAAVHHEVTSPIAPGGTLAVYDLGGGTFDVVILRKDDDGILRIAGEPTGMADFGGADFDDVVMRHVISAAGLSGTDLLSADPSSPALSALRRECVEAKEALSFDAEAVVPVLVGPSHRTVRLTRSEFEEMVEAGLERTVDALAGALEASGVGEGELEAILLTGGSSRIPRVAELLSERFDRPIAVDADPKAIVALGAARAAAESAASSRLDVGEATATADAEPAADAHAADAGGAEDPGDGPAVRTSRRRWRRRIPAAAAVAVASMALAGGAAIASLSGLAPLPVSRAEAPAQSVAWVSVAFLDALPGATDEPAPRISPHDLVSPPTVTPAV